MLTESEKQELKEVRIERQTLVEQIHILEIEKEDVQFEIRKLKEWKKGRWIGFIIALILFFITLGIMFSYSDFQFASSVERGQNWLDALTFSISTTVMIYLSVFGVIFAGASIFFGIKTMLEVGNSKLARTIANNNYIKNYYNMMEDCEIKENGLIKAIIDLKNRAVKLQVREEQLEKNEIPWNKID